MDKPSKLHIKLYVRTEEEKKVIEDHAKEQGLSASSWLRKWALRGIKKERREK